MKYFSLLAALLFFVACNTQQKTEATAAKSEMPAPVTPASPVVNKAKELPKAKPGTDINWLSLEEVQEKVKKEPRKILVDVYTPWCGPCKMMMRSTFKDPTLIKYLEDNYYAVKFNGESGDPINFKGKEYKNPNYNPAIPENRRNSQHQFTQSLGLRGYPTLFIFDPKLNKITESVGMKSAPQLIDILKKLES